MSVRIITGDALEQLRLLPAESVHCVITSPPYYGLRDYGTAQWEGGSLDCGHSGVRRNHTGEKQSTSVGTSRDPVSRDCRLCGARRIDKQIGLEASPAEYVETLVQVFREVRRVLRPDGTLWLNLGDSYSAHAGQRKTTDRAGVKQQSNVASTGAPSRCADGCKPKDLIGIPWFVAFALRQPYYAGRIKSVQDRIWLAAIIDGEGCFFIHKRKSGQAAYSKYTRSDGSEANYSRMSDTYGVGLEISNTSKALIDRVSEIVPGGTFTTQGPEQNGRRKQTIYRWRLSPNETKRLAQELYPHLVAKQHQARLIYSCPSSGDAGAAAHQAMMDLHSGTGTSVDFPPPPSLFEPGWYLRQDIIWGKPNPMPESVRDRCTKAHEYLFLLSKSERYYFDQDAILEPAAPASVDRLSQPTLDQQQGSERVPGKTNGPMKAVCRAPHGQQMHDWARMNSRQDGLHGKVGRTAGNKSHKYVDAYDASETEEHRTKAGLMLVADKPWLMRNRRSVWTVATQPFAESHFATFPPALIEPCILAGCPSGGAVLDPFGGSGTTGLVADRLGRDAVLIELNPDYAEMARRRIKNDAGLFAQVAAE